MQIACILSKWDGDGITEAFAPKFANNVQAGEYWANNLLDLIPVVRQYDEDVPSPEMVAKHNVVQFPIVGGIGFVYVYADATRIAQADNNNNYLVMWSHNTNAIAPEKSPLQNPTESDRTALQDYLLINTDKTLGEIAIFLREFFDVDTNAELETKFLNNPRKDVVNHLARAFATQAHA